MSMRLWLTTLAIVVTGGVPMAAQADDPGLYHPPGMRVWDFWFARADDAYHAFYLQQPAGEGEFVGYPQVGHAASTDLVHWADQGPALTALRNTWNDVAIATGSTVSHAGKWWMVFTGWSTTDGGVGLAVSDDLMRWRKVGDAPIVPSSRRFDATWEGRPLQWRIFADPYVYPEPIDGWFYMVINAGVLDAPLAQRGCIATLRSRDLLTWEPSGIIAYPEWFERMETPQLWQRNGRWYLYFGGAHDSGVPEAFTAVTGVTGQVVRGDYVFTAERFEGPYLPTGKWRLEVPTGGRYSYIVKVLPGPDGQDALLTAQEGKLSPPYRVTYAADGSLVIAAPAPR